MDRREFLKTMGLAAGATLLSGVGVAEAAKLMNKTNKLKIAVLTGSPRRNGNTNHLADQFIKGAKEAGHEVFRFDCAQRKISPCMACNSCDRNGPCVFQDDFEEFRPRIIEADVIVFASPMYSYGFSSQIKMAIDRFYALLGDLHGKTKRTALLMAYGEVEPEIAEPMIAHYHRMRRSLGWTDAGMVVAPGMWSAGAVNNTKYSQMAYELGLNI